MNTALYLERLVYKKQVVQFNDMIADYDKTLAIG